MNCILVQWMSNKTQLHLNTVDFREALAGPFRQSCQSFAKPKQCATEGRASSAHPGRREARGQALSKKHSAQLTPAPSASNADFMVRFSELSINRQSMRDFTKKQFFQQQGAFPRRETLLSNASTFKYFVHSAINKPAHTEQHFLQDFYAKIRRAAEERGRKGIADNQSRRKAITESATTTYHPSRPHHPSRPSRGKRLKAHKNPELPLEEAAGGGGGGVEPWQTSPLQDGLYLTDL